MGYVPLRHSRSDRPPPLSVAKPLEVPILSASRFTAIINEDFSQATTALYEREVARGVQENEEIFAGEEEVSSSSKPQWANKYRPRKPRYFNRVQMGYEWNKYNQTHYDHDNPPPKVVQGYKFNIFYPDLIDKVKAPTYRIERENGRKRGQSFAPAGEEDTCLIRFISGPPYEDVAFRIVDKEWDYSAKRERGFRSSFDKVSGFVRQCPYGCDSYLLLKTFVDFKRLTWASFRASCSSTFSLKRYISLCTPQWGFLLNHPTRSIIENESRKSHSHDKNNTYSIPELYDGLDSPNALEIDVSIHYSYISKRHAMIINKATNILMLNCVTQIVLLKSILSNAPQAAGTLIDAM